MLYHRPCSSDPPLTNCVPHIPISPYPHTSPILISTRQYGSPRHASPTEHSPRQQEQAHSPRDSDDDTASLSESKSATEIPSLMDLSVTRPAASVSSPLLPLPTPKPEMILPLPTPNIAPSLSQNALPNRFRQSPNRQTSPPRTFNDPYGSPRRSGTNCLLKESWFKAQGIVDFVRLLVCLCVCL